MQCQECGNDIFITNLEGELNRDEIIMEKDDYGLFQCQCPLCHFLLTASYPLPEKITCYNCQTVLTIVNSK